MPGTNTLCTNFTLAHDILKDCKIEALSVDQWKLFLFTDKFKLNYNLMSGTIEVIDVEEDSKLETDNIEVDKEKCE